MGISKDSFERCCRLCAEEQEVTIMIFSEEAEAMLLQNKLNKYMLIEVDEDDKLPKNICIRCCSKLQIVCDFIDMARKAQEILQNQSLDLENPGDKSNHIKIELKSDPESEDDAKFIPMEISVDPMVVLQNSRGSISPNTNEQNHEPEQENVTYLHDGEDVTIKLIKKGDTQCESDDKKDNGIKPFPCVRCNRGFYTELALKNHSWTHFNEDKFVKPYKCSSCRDQFEYKTDFMQHLKKHRTSGMCQICGRIFRTEKNLNAHMAAHSSANCKAFTCKVCGRSYNTRSNLKTHSVTHSNDRPFKCSYCKKCFKRNQDLKFHINQHTGAKPYKCPFCDKCFASSGNCYSHRSRVHADQRVEGKKRKRVPVTRENLPVKLRPIAPRPIAPKHTYPAIKTTTKYQCTLCEHSFLRRDNFTYHMYQHTGEKPFQCSNCNEKFVTRRGLLIHHDKMHPEKDRPLALLSKNVLLQ